MTFERRNLGYLISFLIVGLVFGYYLGLFLERILPVSGVINKYFIHLKDFDPGIIKISFKINFSMAAGLLLGLFIFRKV